MGMFGVLTCESGPSGGRGVRKPQLDDRDGLWLPPESRLGHAPPPPRPFGSVWRHRLRPMPTASWGGFLGPVRRSGQAELARKLPDLTSRKYGFLSKSPFLKRFRRVGRVQESFDLPKQPNDLDDGQPQYGRIRETQGVIGGTSGSLRDDSGSPSCVSAGVSGGSGSVGTHSAVSKILVPFSADPLPPTLPITVLEIGRVPG